MSVAAGLPVDAVNLIDASRVDAQNRVIGPVAWLEDRVSPHSVVGDGVPPVEVPRVERVLGRRDPRGELRQVVVGDRAILREVLDRERADPEPLAVRVEDRASVEIGRNPERRIESEITEEVPDVDWGSLRDARLVVERDVRSRRDHDVRRADAELRVRRRLGPISLHRRPCDRRGRRLRPAVHVTRRMPDGLRICERPLRRHQEHELVLGAGSVILIALLLDLDLRLLVVQPCQRREALACERRTSAGCLLPAVHLLATDPSPV